MVFRFIFVPQHRCKRLGRDLCRFSQFAANIPEVAVLQSTSNDVFANLAFEDWVYKNVDLSNRRILFLWRNTPTVVIGRHQNPWSECSLSLVEKHGVKLARRMSGGGAVFHDLGNINVTFFAPRMFYNRKENLSLIVSALQDRWKVEVGVSCRDDIILNGKYKISGSSSKLARVQTYHHCTLLCDVRTSLLRDLLNPTYNNLHGKSTASVKSDVMNLSSIDKTICYSTVTEVLARTFYRNYESLYKEIIDIDPTNRKDFPGLADIQEELQSWDWRFGQTPKFCVNFCTELSFGSLSVSFETFHGLIEDVKLHYNNSDNLDFLQRIPLILKGLKFSQKEIRRVLNHYLEKQAFIGAERKNFVEMSRWLEQTVVSSTTGMF